MEEAEAGGSFTVSYKRVALSVFEQAPGAYEFWGEYHPPKLTVEEMGLLQHADIDFASASGLEVLRCDSGDRTEALSTGAKS